MMNSPYILERLVEEKLDELRAQGMRSQMIARMGIREPGSFHLPDLQLIFHAVLSFAARLRSRRKIRLQSPGC